MEIVKLITEYIFLGTTFMLLLDLMARFYKMDNPMTNTERVFIILLFPLTFLLFLGTFVKTYLEEINKRKK